MRIRLTNPGFFLDIIRPRRFYNSLPLSGEIASKIIGLGWVASFFYQSARALGFWFFTKWRITHQKYYRIKFDSLSFDWV